jgi:hypothetical protein
LRRAGIEDEQQLFRVVIEMLLVREFGAPAANDPSFQQIGNWVYDCLLEQEQTRAMLRGVIDGEHGGVRAAAQK